MRALPVVAPILAGMLLTVPAGAQITEWSVPSAKRVHVHAVHLTVLGTVALPEGEFARPPESDAAFALAGGGAGVEGSIEFSHGIELGAMLLFDRNDTRAGALAASLTARFRRTGLAPYPEAVEVSRRR